MRDDQHPDNPYTQEQARHWLTFLASNMQRYEQTIFLIGQM